jgi:hypothetical protein
MTDMTWKDFIKRAHFYFKKPQLPNADTFEIWQDEIGKFPEEFYAWAWDTCKSREERLPENLPRYIKALWQEWVNRNPLKVERKEFQCRQKHCQQGFLFAVKGHNNFVFRCLECNGLEDYPAIPGSTMHALELDGYRPDTVD